MDGPYMCGAHGYQKYTSQQFALALLDSGITHRVSQCHFVAPGPLCLKHATVPTLKGMINVDINSQSLLSTIEEKIILTPIKKAEFGLSVDGISLASTASIVPRSAFSS